MYKRGKRGVLCAQLPRRRQAYHDNGGGEFVLIGEFEGSFNKKDNVNMANNALKYVLHCQDRHDFKMKMDPPTFDGRLSIEDFLD